MLPRLTTTSPQVLTLAAVFCSVFLAATAQGSCRKDELAVQKVSPFPQTNGCSKPAGITVGGEEDFTYCCDRHDACYQTCGVSKDFCEKDFGKCMKSLCKTTFPTNPQCASAASMYELGVSMFGGDPFLEEQRKHCECVPKDMDSLLSHYTKVVRRVYEVASKKTTEEVDAVVEKFVEAQRVKSDGNLSKAAKAMSKLFYELMKTYDEAIEHIGPRKKMDPPRPSSSAKKTKKKQADPKTEF